ncbi:MAG TPA: hypothetical protein VGA86_06395 [Desulfatiglandales bacterium]
MKPESNHVETTNPDRIEIGPFKCSKCGRTLKSFHDWIMGNGNTLCASCYQSMIFPHNHRICGEVLE